MQWQFICWKLIKFEHCQFTHWHYRSYRHVKNKNKKIFLFFPATVLPLCALPVLSLSLSALCIWPPFSFNFTLCAIPVFSSLHSYSNAVCQGDGLPGGESVHQWLCADVERLESQALPTELQKGTGPPHWTAKPTVKPTSVSCVFLIANVCQGEVILHTLNKVQYTVWIYALYPAPY